MTLVRPNEFVIDLGAVAHNARLLRSRVGDRFIFAALKADGYGYGCEAVASLLAKSGIDGFSMVDVAQAVSLRKAGFTQPILLYPGVPLDEDVISVMEAHSLIPTVVDVAAAALLIEKSKGPLAPYVKVDVGLERLGTAAEGLREVVKVLQTGGMRIGGVYGHMHIPVSGWEPGYMEWQYERFCQAFQGIEWNGEQPVRMLASTGVVAHTRSMLLDAVDPGRWFFGLIGEGEGESRELRPAFHRLQSRLVQVKAVGRDQRGGLPSPLDKEVSRIGVVPVGRVDGVASVTGGQMIVRGRRVDIVGGPSIEHTRVDLSDSPDARAGDPVVLIGEEDGAIIAPGEVAARHGVQSPCLLGLGVGSGFRRCYME